jgi:hypothetical protein
MKPGQRSIISNNVIRERRAVVRWLFMPINSKEYSKQADEKHRFSLHFARIVNNI